MSSKKLPMTRAQALQRLESFAPFAGLEYQKNRNFDQGPENHDAVSQLSTALTHRILTEEEILSEVLRLHTTSQASAFISEVFWKTYWHGWMWHHPQVYVNFKTAIKNSNLCLKESAPHVFSAATGIECFDFWLRELNETGYLHNHARMWFASIWIFHFQLPWFLGADLFEKRLSDSDDHVNLLSWRWVAGLHTRGKQYLATSENISNFTNQRFSKLTLDLHPLPISEDEFKQKATSFDSEKKHFRDIHVLTTGELMGPLESPHSALLLWHDDLSLANVPDLNKNHLSSKRARKAFFIDHRSLFPASSPVRQNVLSALERDVSARLLQKGWEPTRVNNMNDLYQSCCSENISRLHMMLPRQGKLKDKLMQLQTLDVKSILYMRKWDSVVFPHCTRGFYTLKKKIPQLLSELKLDASCQPNGTKIV